MTSPNPCAICGKPQVPEYRPFCSKRCADVDLNRWLSGAYVIPGKEIEDEDGPGGSGDTGTDDGAGPLLRS